MHALRQRSQCRWILKLFLLFAGDLLEYCTYSKLVYALPSGNVFNERCIVNIWLPSLYCGGFVFECRCSLLLYCWCGKLRESRPNRNGSLLNKHVQYRGGRLVH